MSWPWEFDPVNGTGRAPVSTSDRIRIALKYVAVIAGIVAVRAMSIDGEVGQGFLGGFGIALFAAGLIDSAWLTWSKLEMVLLKNRAQQRLLATAELVVGAVLLILWMV
jgi:hypothetical protein